MVGMYRNFLFIVYLKKEEYLLLAKGRLVKKMSEF